MTRLLDSPYSKVTSLFPSLILRSLFFGFQFCFVFVYESCFKLIYYFNWRRKWRNFKVSAGKWFFKCFMSFFSTGMIKFLQISSTANKKGNTSSLAQKSKRFWFHKSVTIFGGQSVRAQIVSCTETENGSVLYRFCIRLRVSPDCSSFTSLQK